MIEIFIITFIILVILIAFIYFFIIYPNIIVNRFFTELYYLHKNYISYSCMDRLLKKYNAFRNNKIRILTQRLDNFYDVYDNLPSIVEQLNEEYIQEELEDKKDYFDNIFKYPLDEEQRRAIITDDDNNLIIAGAGSGKTTTIIGKTKYLIEKKGVNPEEIITISFTRAAKDNFVEKLNDERVKCSTFHKLGKDILEEGNYRRTIADENLINGVIRKYFEIIIKEDKKKSKNYVGLCSYYMHDINSEDKDFGDVIQLEKGYDLETLKAKYNKSKKLNTLHGERVKSLQELIIANYLFIHGINYEYERSYKFNTANIEHRQYLPDFYLVDYDIYLEHFGINENGRAPQYTPLEEQRYLNDIKFKRELHKKYKTKMIETYSYDFNNYGIEKVLKQKLKSNGVEFHDLDYREVVDIINHIENEEMNSFHNLISKFIKMFKGNNYQLEKFDEFYEDAEKKGNTRAKYLLEIIKDIYICYQKELVDQDKIDFDDMINLATERVMNSFDKKISYIIIDEFQDISYSRYLLVRAIQYKTNAKVVAVGDDWQSIYRFSGCDLNLFVNFGYYFEHPKIMYITNTYRNSQNLIDIAGSFIMKNEKGQIRKKLVSNVGNIKSPIEFCYYVNNIIGTTKFAVKKLKDAGCNKIAILGRNNSDINNYKKNVIKMDKEIDLSNIFDYNVVFTTVHKSKGLEYDGVIICNFNNSLSGFPNKMSDDPILNYVTLTKDDYLFEEERRLLYVALTRTKTKCMILVPTINNSIFTNELFEISNKTIVKNIIEDDERLHNPKCPRCRTGVIVVRKNGKNNTTFVGCSNYPRCDFTYSKTDIIENTIECPTCHAYMVKRNGRYGEFYGCMNYPYCTQTIESENNRRFNKKEIFK